MQCSTSMMAAFNVAGVIEGGVAELGLAGGSESMTHVQAGLSQRLSDRLRGIAQARRWSQRLKATFRLRPGDFRLQFQSIKNRSTGKSMGEHSEETAKEWGITRGEQDALALESHRRAVAAQDRGFFKDLIVAVDGVDSDAFPRRD